MVVFRGFAAIRIAVTGLPAAVTAWRDQLGWPPGAVSGDGATFPLDGTTIELRPASAGQLTGVTAVAVSVDDTERAVLRAESAGYRVQRAADGTALLAARGLNGVALERLRRSGARLIAAPDTGQVFVHPATTHGVLIEVTADPLPPATS